MQHGQNILRQCLQTKRQATATCVHKRLGRVYHSAMAYPVAPSTSAHSTRSTAWCDVLQHLANEIGRPLEVSRWNVLCLPHEVRDICPSPRVPVSVTEAGLKSIAQEQTTCSNASFGHEGRMNMNFPLSHKPIITSSNSRPNDKTGRPDWTSNRLFRPPLVHGNMLPDFTTRPTR